MLWNTDNPWHPVTVKGLEGSGRSLGIQLQFCRFEDPTSSTDASGMLAKRAQAILILADPMILRMVRLATCGEASAAGGWAAIAYARAGSLLSYGRTDRPVPASAPSYVDKILKGAKPADLPIEQPTKFELVVNLKTAKALGLTIPQRCCCGRIR